MWDLRPSNVIAYISPTVGGFHGAIAYVTNLNVPSVNATTGALTTNGSGATMEHSVSALSALGMYESGPVMVGLGYEKHNLSNLNGATIATTSPTGTLAVADMQDEKIWRLVGGYNFGDFKAVGLYQKASDVSGENGIGRKTWGLGGAYKMGATTIKAQYYKTNDATGCAVSSDCDNSGANMIAVGADYSLSKRTTAYVAYARTNNDAGATAGTGASFSAFGGGHGDNPGTVAGKDPSGFSLGMKHAF
jgi:predicted porin